MPFILGHSLNHLGTCWISLADASPDNGCMYFIPKSADPGYCRGDYSASHRGGEGAPPKPGTFELIRGPLGASLYSPSTESVRDDSHWFKLDDWFKALASDPCSSSSLIEKLECTLPSTFLGMARRVCNAVVMTDAHCNALDPNACAHPAPQKQKQKKNIYSTQ